jgi:hypothetical protein
MAPSTKDDKKDDGATPSPVGIKAEAFVDGPEAPGVTRGGRLVGNPEPERKLIKGDAKAASISAEASDDNDPLVVVQDDVYEEFYFENTQRPAYRLLFTKGQVVKQSQLDAVHAETK